MASMAPAVSGLCLVVTVALLLSPSALATFAGKSKELVVSSFLTPLSEENTIPRFPGILYISSQSLNGTSFLTLQPTSIAVNLIVFGSTPGEGNVTKNPFNPSLGNPKVFIAEDGNNKGPTLVFTNGTWTPLPGDQFLFSSQVKIARLTVAKMAKKPIQFSLVIAVSPYPMLSDFVYASAGPLFA